MKNLKELADDLKNLIIELQSDAHNKENVRPERYNNLKLTMDPQHNRSPHVIVTTAMSSAEYDLYTAEKLGGSLGPDEKFVIRWLGKSNTLEALRECWKSANDLSDRIYKRFNQKK